MKPIGKLLIILCAFFMPSAAVADLSYNPEHDDVLKNLQAIESAAMNMHYQCKEYSLIISAYATQSDVNGRYAAITGKIMSQNSTHDVSEILKKSISRHNFLTGKLSVTCNADKGAFRLKFEPNEFDTQGYSRTSISIFSDGTVSGSRTIETTTARRKRGR